LTKYFFTKKPIKIKRIKKYRVKTMSLRCKVCNTPSTKNQMSCNEEWECHTCGNILDIKGNVSTSEKWSLIIIKEGFWIKMIIRYTIY
jgi:hypothetical protein